jgi:hypothetical protein
MLAADTSEILFASTGLGTQDNENYLLGCSVYICHVFAFMQEWKILLTEYETTKVCALLSWKLSCACTSMPPSVCPKLNISRPSYLAANVMQFFDNERNQDARSAMYSNLQWPPAHLADDTNEGTVLGKQWFHRVHKTSSPNCDKQQECCASCHIMNASYMLWLSSYFDGDHLCKNSYLFR